jgi:hypothetical protein
MGRHGRLTRARVAHNHHPLKRRPPAHATTLGHSGFRPRPAPLRGRAGAVISARRARGPGRAQPAPRGAPHAKSTQFRAHMTANSKSVGFAHPRDLHQSRGSDLQLLNSQRHSALGCLTLQRLHLCVDLDPGDNVEALLGKSHRDLMTETSTCTSDQNFFQLIRHLCSRKYYFGLCPRMSSNQLDTLRSRRESSILSEAQPIRGVGHQWKSAGTLSGSSRSAGTPLA